MVLNSILIANRGEIACRIAKTATRLGMRTIAIYHHADRNSPHIAMTDEAWEIDNDVPTAAYLDSDRIVEIAQTREAACVHPGYGFLAENSDFARAVEQAGLCFVGPQPDVIRLMGDKIHARDFAARCGVPLAPSALQTTSLERFIDDASAIGFPLLIKAAAGGGGKGMNIVREPAQLADAAERASSEAERYFADGRVYAERYIDRPRHIEVQVLGDGNGDVLHFGERECSVQRRFQKIIEEAPSATLDEDLRRSICAAGVKLAREAAYRNAGTVEFVLAPDDSFYFLEMNTRLQVEHPVTEMVYGIDLVEAQIRIAAGEGLPCRQEDVTPKGHAIECRICCEEPEADFRPATGRVRHLAFADTGEGIRLDGGIVEGQEISAAFDSMVGKLIAHGNDREQAIARLLQALQGSTLLGVSTNIDYLARLIDHRAFREAALHTGFVVEHAASLAATPLASDELAAVLIAAALGIETFNAGIRGTPEPHASIGGWRN